MSFNSCKEKCVTRTMKVPEIPGSYSVRVGDVDLFSWYLDNCVHYCCKYSSMTSCLNR